MPKHFSAERAGREFRNRIATGKILPFIGIYDVFSAEIAAQRFDGVFCSGFSYAASAYGLPDIGFVNWRDITDFSTRIRHVLPDTHILVDIDDGFGDEVVAASVVANLELNGLSAVMMEDQKRPRRCGHFEGKEILPIDEYLGKLERVLEARESIFVIARTDAIGAHEALDRAFKYAEAGADGVMVEAVRDLFTVRQLASNVKCPIMVNQLHGGKSPNWTLDEMEQAGVSIVIYSTPCLFAAQYAIEKYLDSMVGTRTLPPENTVTMEENNKLLYGHLR
jgi:2-methylisocitrate lyase-like PEP mutase family enzyme